MALMHGVELLKVHMHDWIMLFFLGVLAGILHMISPFHRFVGQTMLDDLMHPYKENTVPTWSLPILALVVPLIIFFIYYYWRGDLHDLHHAILGLLFSVSIACVITQAIKDAVGRPRPDFFWRCFPDGIPIFNNVTGNVLCHGDSKIIAEGYKSFPSGHTSVSFSGLGFLSLYLAAKIQIFDRRGHIAKITIVLLPLLVATLVGISRVDDYWHHWQDVFAGAFLGLTMATLCYSQFFPSPSESDVPFGYLQLLTGANANELESKAEENLENGVYYRLNGQSVEESVPIEIIEENKLKA